MNSIEGKRPATVWKAGADGLSGAAAAGTVFDPAVDRVDVSDLPGRVTWPRLAAVSIELRGSDGSVAPAALVDLTPWGGCALVLPGMAAVDVCPELFVGLVEQPVSVPGPGDAPAGPRRRPPGGSEPCPPRTGAWPGGGVGPGARGEARSVSH